MLATLYNFAFVEHIDAVGILDGGEAVGDGYRGAGLHEAFQSLLHQAFAFGIEGGGRFVQYQDSRVFQDSTGNGDALALAS